MRPQNWRKPIGQILIDKGLLTPEQLNKALALQQSRPGQKIGQILVELGHVTMQEVLRAYAEQLGAIYEGGIDTD